VNGEEYILSGSEGGSYSSYGIYNGTRGTWESYEGESEPTVYRNTWNDLLIDIAPALIDETFLYPMVRNASVNDSTFEVYHESVKDYLGTASTKNSTSIVTDSTDLVESGAVKDIVGWGNKNLYSYPYGTRQVVGADGTITNNDVLFLTDYIPVSGNVISSFSERVGNATVRIAEYDANKTFINRLLSVQNNHLFELNENTKYIRINVEDFSAYFSNLMVRFATITDATYEPYHASVEESKCDNSVIGTVEDGTNPTKSYAVDEFMVRDGAFCQVTAPVTTSSTWIEGSNYTKKSIAEVLQSLMS
jgi:hypothetical protein